MENTERVKWPIVTIFTLVFNTGKYVIEALDSVKNNNYPSIQHIIIDDCSFDGKSVQLVEKWIEDNNYDCTFIKHRKNMGITKSINEALALAKGKYIFGVGDDLILPEKVRLQVELLENASPEYGVVYSDAYLIKEDGSPRFGTFIQYNRQFVNIPQGDIFDTLLEGNFIPAMAVLIKTECFKKVGIYDEKLGYEDYDMWLRIAKDYKFIFSDYISAKYRIHENNLHINKTDWGIDNYRIFSKHLKDRPVLINNLEAIVEKLYMVRDYNQLNIILDDFGKQYNSKPLLYYCSKAKIPYIWFRIIHKMIITLRQRKLSFTIGN